ncbi:MAG: hypothetical protein HOW73_47670 [Polyangiaceae bacterium]|nr:hypothetical protein [Polyangiaceae bacterium]
MRISLRVMAEQQHAMLKGTRGRLCFDMMDGMAKPVPSVERIERKARDQMRETLMRLFAMSEDPKTAKLEQWQLWAFASIVGECRLTVWRVEELADGSQLGRDDAFDWTITVSPDGRFVSVDYKLGIAPMCWLVGKTTAEVAAKARELVERVLAKHQEQKFKFVE